MPDEDAALPDTLPDPGALVARLRALGLNDGRPAAHRDDVGLGLVLNTRDSTATTFVGAVVLAVGPVPIALGFRRDQRLTTTLPRLYSYERGMVLSTPPHDLEPYAWRDVLPYEWIDVSENGQGRKVRNRRLRLTTPGGRDLFRLSNFEADTVADIATADELPRARQRLERGEAVAYGLFTISPDGLTLGGVTYAWSDIRFVGAGLTEVVISLRDGLSGRRPSAPAARTPYVRALLALANSYAEGQEQPEHGLRPQSGNSSEGVGPARARERSASG